MRKIEMIYRERGRQKNKKKYYLKREILSFGKKRERGKE